MNQLNQKWHNANYQTKFYIIAAAVVAFLFASVFLIANIRFYKNGENIAALTQRTGETVSVHNAGIVTILDAHPPFQWTGGLPDITIAAAELPFQESGAYTVEGTPEDACLRLIQAGFIFDTGYGGTALSSKEKTCYLYFNDRTLIAQIEDLGDEND